MVDKRKELETNKKASFKRANAHLSREVVTFLDKNQKEVSRLRAILRHGVGEWREAVRFIALIRILEKLLIKTSFLPKEDQDATISRLNSIATRLKDLEIASESDFRTSEDFLPYQPMTRFHPHEARRNGINILKHERIDVGNILLELEDEMRNIRSHINEDSVNPNYQ